MIRAEYKIGEVTPDKQMGRTLDNVEGAICPECNKAEWGDGEKRNL
jgi:hypothetical protein